MSSVTVTSVNLENGLFEVPDPEKVKELKCCNDAKIDHVPAGIEKLTHLQYLNLSNTGIASIPDSIAELRELKILDLRGTPITHLPKALLQSDHPITILLLGCNKVITSNFSHKSRNVTLVFPQ